MATHIGDIEYKINPGPLIVGGNTGVEYVEVTTYGEFERVFIRNPSLKIKCKKFDGSGKAKSSKKIDCIWCEGTGYEG